MIEKNSSDRSLVTEPHGSLFGIITLTVPELMKPLDRGFLSREGGPRTEMVEPLATTTCCRVVESLIEITRNIQKRWFW